MSLKEGRKEYHNSRPLRKGLKVLFRLTTLQKSYFEMNIDGGMILAGIMMMAIECPRRTEIPSLLQVEKAGGNVFLYRKERKGGESGRQPRR
ncbi:MAG: hypothetical protein Q9N34_00595 [Aquificota bacterium]|nr:hypothetical protein [Aquificota bacterium]